MGEEYRRTLLSRLIGGRELAFPSSSAQLPGTSQTSTIASAAAAAFPYGIHQMGISFREQPTSFTVSSTAASATPAAFFTGTAETRHSTEVGPTGCTVATTAASITPAAFPFCFAQRRLSSGEQPAGCTVTSTASPAATLIGTAGTRPSSEVQPTSSTVSSTAASATPAAFLTGTAETRHFTEVRPTDCTVATTAASITPAAFPLYIAQRRLSSGEQTAGCTGPTVSHRRSRSNSNPSKKPRFSELTAIFKKSVCVVRSPNTFYIPRTEKEVDYYARNKLICDIHDFDKNWTEERVIQEFIKVFPKHLNTRNFRVMKACKKKLYELNLSGNSLNGENLFRVFNQLNTIYLQPDRDLTDEESDSDVELGGFEPLRNISSTEPEPFNFGAVMNPPQSNDVGNSPESEPVRNISSIEPELSNSGAVTNSPQSNDVVMNQPESMSNNITPSSEEGRLKNLLNSIIIDDDEQALHLIVERGNEFETARVQLVDEDNFGRPLRVEYTDSLGCSEPGSDGGGLSRNFFNSSLDDVKNSRMFCGEDHAKDLIYDEFCDTERKYYSAGLQIALSLVHGGTGPNFFSPHLYNCITKGIMNVTPTENNIQDADVKADLFILKVCSTEENLNTLVTQSRTFTMCSSAEEPTLAKKAKIYEEAIEYHGRTVLIPAFEQLMEGLTILGLKDLIQNNGDAFQSVFVFCPKKLTFATFMKIFEIKRSVEGSNRNRIESSVLFLWCTFLREVEAGRVTVTLEETYGEEVAKSIRLKVPGRLSLEDILRVATGASAIPPKGFDFEPSIVFLHDKPRSPSIEAASCDGTIRLPVSLTSTSAYSTFKANTIQGLVNNLHYFGKL